MKKFIAILIVAFLTLFASQCFAAGTVTGATTYLVDGLSGRFEHMKITYTVTFGDDASSPANTTLNDISDSSGVALYSAQGWWLLKIDIYPGGTGPTDNTDLYLWYVADKIDVLGNNGLNSIDNATFSTVYPATSTQPLTGDEILDIDNNAVNDAGTVLIFTFYRN